MNIIGINSLPINVDKFCEVVEFIDLSRCFIYAYKSILFIESQ